jgi:hypothetical protein
VPECECGGSAHLLPLGLGASALGGAGADKIALDIGQSAEYGKHQAPGAGALTNARCSPELFLSWARVAAGNTLPHPFSLNSSKMQDRVVDWQFL